MKCALPGNKSGFWKDEVNHGLAARLKKRSFVSGTLIVHVVPRAAQRVQHWNNDPTIDDLFFLFKYKKNNSIVDYCPKRNKAVLKLDCRFCFSSHSALLTSLVLPSLSRRVLLAFRIIEVLPEEVLDSLREEYSSTTRAASESRERRSEVIHIARITEHLLRDHDRITRRVAI